MKILIEIDTDTQRVVPVSRLTVREIPPLFADEGRQEQLNQYHFIGGWNALVSLLASAPQPEPVNNLIRVARLAELVIRMDESRRLKDYQLMHIELNEAIEIAATISQGEQK